MKGDCEDGYLLPFSLLPSPFSLGPLAGLNIEVQLELVGMWPQAHRIDFLAALILKPRLNRSEERRVGKECRL